MDPKLQIAVVGATGVVGREILAALQDRGHPGERITALASERSEGEELEYLDETLEVEKASAESFRGIGLALFAVPPAVAQGLAPAAQAAGAWVVDVSPSFRLREGTPLVLPGVNDAVLRAPFTGRIVSCPSPVITGLLTALEPLRTRMGVEQVQVTALLGASHHGKSGVDALEKQTADLLSGREPEPGQFPHRLAFNVIPQVGDFTGEWTAEESAWPAEAARVWGWGPKVSGTALQVPTFYGVALVVTARLGAPASAAQVRDAMRANPRLKVLDEPGEKVYPMPMLVTADPAVHVGRIRQLPEAPEWVTFVAALDNTGRGAALNAVEVAEQLGSDNLARP